MICLHFPEIKSNSGQCSGINFFSFALFFTHFTALCLSTNCTTIPFHVVSGHLTVGFVEHYSTVGSISDIAMLYKKYVQSWLD